MLMLGLNETLNKLNMVNSVCLYGHVLRREDSHVLRRALHTLRLKIKVRKGGHEGYRRSRLRKKQQSLVLAGMMPFADQSGWLALI